MKILMVGGVANVANNLKKGLEQRGHIVVLVHNKTVFDDVSSDYPLNWSLCLSQKYGHDFDVVHVHSPNLKKCLLTYPYVRAGVPLVCHWHGSDLRLWKKSFLVKSWCIRHAKMNLYSTCDLAWWIQTPHKRLLNCPVDCMVFKQGSTPGEGLVTFNGGSNAYKTHHIPHKEMPGYLQRYRSADIHNAMGLDDQLYSVIAFECAACGLQVHQFPWMNRDWVLKNADIPIIAKELEEIYKNMVKRTR